MIMDSRPSPPKDVAGFNPIATSGDCWFDHNEAERASKFFAKALVHTKGKWAGKPFKLEPWQEDYIRTLFGWKRPDGSRRFRSSLLFIPRKNGKSQIAAGIASYVFFCDHEAEAECYCAASNRDQAGLVFNATASMIEKQPKLLGKCKIRSSYKRIVSSKDRSFIRAIPANEGGAHGFNAHLVVGDELHT